MLAIALRGRLSIGRLRGLVNRLLGESQGQVFDQNEQESLLRRRGSRRAVQRNERRLARQGSAGVSPSYSSFMVAQGEKADGPQPFIENLSVAQAVRER